MNNHNDSKNKPVRYQSRDEIEENVKTLGIDRSRFHEYSKTGYQKVIDHFYYAFVDHKGIKKPDLKYCWLNFRKDLKQTAHITAGSGISWDDMIHGVKDNMRYDWTKKLFLILDDGWVYEGYIDEMISVMNNTEGMTGDFYFVTPQYDRFAAYCEDGDCMVYYEK